MLLLSVIIPVYNEVKTIANILEKINSVNIDKEIIIVDDGSTDRSREIINSYKDKRVKIICNKAPLGPAKARNLGIKKSRGEILFFTDADCYADKDWLKNSINYFRKHKCLGIEGKLYYISKDYISTLSDQLTVTLEESGKWMTGNVAYRKSAFNKVGLFNENIKFQEDRELALRMIKYGDVPYCKDMIITHMEKKWTIKGFINNGKRIESILQLCIWYNDKMDIKMRIVIPMNLLKIIIFPYFHKLKIIN